MLKAKPPAAAARPRWMNRGRRGLTLTLVSVAVLLSSLSFGLAAQHARVTPPDGLNLRSDASTAAGVVTVLPFGAMVDVLGGPSEDGWYRVAAQGQQGFVKGAFLDFTPPPPLRGDALVAPADGVRLRASPTLSAQILTVLPPGAQVRIFGDATADGWYSVQVNGSVGWVDGSYLQALPPDAQAARITWYGHDFDGGVLACGGTFSADDPGVAATNGWPCGTHLRVCQGPRCVVVNVRDRGHLPPGAIDLSAAAFLRLAPLEAGVLAGTLQVTSDAPAPPTPASVASGTPAPSPLP